MPIISPASVAHTIVSLTVDMTGPFLVAEFLQTLDGKTNGTKSLHIDGADLAAILGTPGDPAKSRADDITDAVYAHAIASGKITGVIA